jgi:hypothetical protein
MGSLLLRNGQLRTLLLNLSILLILAAAWVADRWADLSWLAISLGILIMGLETAWLYLAARAARRRASSEAGRHMIPEAVFAAHSDVPTDSIETSDGYDRVLVMGFETVLAKSIETTVPLDPLMAELAGRLMKRNHTKLDSWNNIERLREGTFTLDAGAFDIELADGRASVRMSSRRRIIPDDPEPVLDKNNPSERLHRATVAYC